VELANEDHSWKVKAHAINGKNFFENFCIQNFKIFLYVACVAGGIRD
jgi:hypothetical protein